MFNRRSIRLKGYDYSQEGLYFITICCKDRICHFGKIENQTMILNENGKIADKYWNEIPQHFPNIILHDFIIMPNHIHGIIEITNAVGAKNFSPNHSSNITSEIENNVPQEKPKGTSKTIGSIVRGFKIGVTKHLGFSIWQRNYYEHIIRNDKSHSTITDYIQNNPLKWNDDRFFI